jgi:hypothetical protein
VDVKASSAELGFAGRARCAREQPDKTLASDAFADGEVVWSWRPLLASRESRLSKSGRRTCRPDGDKNEFVTGESTKETVKTIAQGMPGDSGGPVVTRA